MSKYMDEKIEKFAKIFKALADPNRLKIFLRLVSCCQPYLQSGPHPSPEQQGCACVGDLGQNLGLVPSTISHHIKRLREAGLIRMERRGQKIECWIDPQTLSVIRSFFS